MSKIKIHNKTKQYVQWTNINHVQNNDLEGEAQQRIWIWGTRDWHTLYWILCKLWDDSMEPFHKFLDQTMYV